MEATTISMCNEYKSHFSTNVFEKYIHYMKGSTYSPDLKFIGNSIDVLEISVR